ncbi:MAG TPA: carbamoyltransferase C-terminal domain-containing protein [Bacteroidales bacterium]|nr:carbamoyltransferase C-terminal domain-containing protein [Bacteroidales bacterium]
MYILGINAAFHDSSACLLKDGLLLAAAEEERFTHFKYGKRPVPFSTWELPFHAIDYCLHTAGIHLSDVDHIAYSFDPFVLLDKEYAHNRTISVPLNYTDPADGTNPWEPLMLSYIVNAPGQLADGWPHHLQKRFIGSKISDWEWHYVEHHLAHAASAFYPSPFKRAAILTMDGRGEKASTTYSTGKDYAIQRIGQVNLPHSLGLLYERVTTHLGFMHSGDEYKVMALASYGKPEYLRTFRKMIHVGEKGQYTIDFMDFDACFGPKRLRHEPFESNHFNIAHSLQKVLEETAVQITDWLQQETGEENLCTAGGVALNCVMNSKIAMQSGFKNVWVQPASGDSGTALGAALQIDSELRNGTRSFEMTHAYWGPEYTDEEIEKFLVKCKIPYIKTDQPAVEAAGLLVNNKIIGWYQGRMEFGPRALGSRSILASPVDPQMQARLNEIKDREDFRPVAPVVLEEDAPFWFEDAVYSPFMLFVYNVVKDKADQIPAVRHVDGTARIQTINGNQHPLYYQLLKTFKDMTGVPVLVNTSFNTLGKPIVCTPRDAIECFWSSPFDALVIGSFIIDKSLGTSLHATVLDALSKEVSLR